MIFAAMSAFVVLSCVEEQDMSPVTEGQMTFTVVAEQTVTPEPKSVIVKDEEGHHSILWSAEDVIKVYNDLAPVGADYTLTGEAGSSSASFVGPKTEGALKYWAAYPSVAGSACAEGVFTGLVVPAQQTAVAGTYPADAYVSVAAADEERNLQFRNACALIKIELGSEYAYVKKIVIEDKDGEAALAGTFSCTLGPDGITMGEVTNASKSVTLLPPAGKNAFEPGIYYVSCLPESLSGVKLTCTTVLDDQTSKAGGAIALTKNMVLALPVVDGATVALPAVPADKSYNSYIVTPGQSVTFTKKKAGIISLDLAWQDASNLISSMSVNNETGHVTVATNDVAGNALVLGKDANGKTLWSWHVWAVDFNPETTAVTVDGVTFMDRNLGAVSAAENDINAVGHTYQWGRKDPLPRATSFATGYAECAIYDINGNSLTPYSGANANGGQYYKFIPEASSGQTVTKADAVANAEYFFCRNEYNVAWWLGIDPEDAKDLWGGVSLTKSEYDPCPQGWKVPVVSADNKHPFNFVTSEAAVVDADNKGLRYTTADNETLWFPYTGERTRSEGLIARTARGGNYWTGTFDSLFEKTVSGKKQVHELYKFMQFKANGTKYLTGYKRQQYVATGLAVRCVKE